MSAPSGPGQPSPATPAPTVPPVGRLVTLTGHPVQVVSGTVSVLVADDHGVRYPLGRLEAGTLIVPATGIQLLLAPDLGAVIQQEPSTRDTDALAPWLDLLCDNIADPQAADRLRSASLDELPAAVGHALKEEINSRALAWQRQLEAMDRSDRQRVDAVLRASAQLVADPFTPTPGQYGSELVTAIAQVGRHCGFLVKDVPLADLSGEDALRRVAVANALRYRRVRVDIDGWDADPATALLATIARDDADPEYVALLPRRRRFWIFRPSEGALRPLTGADRSRLGPHAWDFTAPLPQHRPVSWWDLAKLGLRGSSSFWFIVVAASLAISVLGLLTPLLANSVLGFIVPNNELGLLVTAGAALATAAGLAMIFAIVQTLAVSRTTQHLQWRIQSALWDRTLSMSPRFFRRFSSGDLTSRVLAAQQVTSLLSAAMVSQLLAAVFALVNLPVLYYLSPPLALITVAILALTTIFIGLQARTMRALAQRSVDGERIATSWIVQVLTGIAKVRVAAGESRLVASHQERIHVLIETQVKQSLATARITAFFLAAGALAPAALFMGVLVFQWGPAGPELSPDAYVAFSLAFTTVFTAFAGLSAVMAPVATARPIMQMSKPILDGVPDIGGEDPGRLRGEIECRRVSFRYSPTSPPALREVSFQVRPGELIAIVGPSGSGKSTLLRLLLGLDVPDDGEILVDGRRLLDLDRADYRSKLGVVIQDAKLMNASIRDNIAAGESLDDDAIWLAAQAAAIDADIHEMPMGLETIVDDTTVSGGQAQRLLLARSLARKPGVLMFDEATSALDNASQARVTASMNELIATRIVIAHRLSTVVHADRILVMDAGSIVETGTYQELMDQAGQFRRLVQRQLVERPTETST